MSKQFSALIWDYAVFGIFLICSTIYPIWRDIVGRKGESTKANYVFAAGRISMIPMMLSIARGTLGVRSFLGYPSELFYRGAGMWETLFGIVTAYPIVCFVFVPVYCNLDITSVYQYLDLRFKSKLVRRFASFSFIVRNCLSLGITVYTPCVALNTIAGIPYWLSLLAMTICTIILSISGGLKAAIMADAIQGLTLMFVCICVVIQGVYSTGDVDTMYKINRDNDRLDFFSFSGDVTTRVDTMSAWIGQTFVSLSVMGCQQNLVQRYLSMKSVKKVRNTLLVNIPCIAFLFSLTWICGMAIYSTYYQCDPLAAGYTEKYDSILPFFVNDKLSYIPGFMGLFLATLFNGALCLNVSNINSLATVTWEDFLSAYFKDKKDKQQLTSIKYLAFVYAVFIMAIGFCVSFLSGVIESAMLTSSATTGPLVGVFLLAILVPMANAKGVVSGMLASHILTLVLICGRYTISKTHDIVLPTSTEGCTNATFSPWIEKLNSPTWLLQNELVEINWMQNFTTLNHVQPTTPSAPLHHQHHEQTFSETLFGLTYMYYGAVGTCVTIIVAIIVSHFTATEEDAFDEQLLHPMIVKLKCWCNGKATVTSTNVECNIISTQTNDNPAFELNENNSTTKNNQQQIISHASNNDNVSINDEYHSKSMEKFTPINIS